MARNADYTDHLYECARNATQKMQEKLSTPEGAMEEAMRQSYVMQQNIYFENNEKKALMETEHLKYTG